MKNVFFEYGCFTSILSAVIESYPNETYGFVGGEETQKRYYLKMSPPLQSAVRKNSSVEFKDKKRYNQAKDVISAMGLTIVGGFHSHPKSLPYPSEMDLITAGLENLNKKIDPYSSFTDKWLEIVVGLQAKKYKKNFKPTISFDYSSKKIKGKLRVNNNSYAFEIVGYWVDMDEISEGEFYPSVEVADLSILDNSFPKTWAYE